MAFSEKKFCEETVGLAQAMMDQADEEGRDFTAAENQKFNSLLGVYSSVMGTKPPKEHAAFRAWAKRPNENRAGGASLMGSNVTSGIGHAPAPPSGLASQTTFVDDKGEVFPCVGKGESFEAAVREKANRYGVSERDQKFQELMGDGLTIGGLLRAKMTGARTSAERCALQGDDSTGGGYTIPTFLSAQIIDMFRARNQAVAAGAQTVQMKAESHSFARVTSVPTCGWVREIQTVPESDMTFGKITFTARNLRCVLKASRNLLEDAPNIDSLIEQELSKSLAAEVDRAALYGLGTAEPSGLISDTAINEVAVGGPLTGYDEILDGYKLMLDDNAPDPTALIIANQEWAYFAKLKDGDGQPAARPPAIAGLPFLPTTKATAGQMLLGYFPDLILAVLANLRIDLLRELYAETHQFGFLCHLRMDAGTQRSESFCKLTGITL
jgi:HK97 family phage major capsid protein